MPAADPVVVVEEAEKEARVPSAPQPQPSSSPSPPSSPPHLLSRRESAPAEVDFTVLPGMRAPPETFFYAQSEAARSPRALSSPSPSLSEVSVVICLDQDAAEHDELVDAEFERNLAEEDGISDLDELESELPGEEQDEYHEEFQCESQEDGQDELHVEHQDELQDEYKNELQDDLHDGLQDRIEHKHQQELQNELQDKVQDEYQQELQDELEDEHQTEHQDELQDELQDDDQDELQDELQDEHQNKYQNGHQDELQDKIQDQLQNEYQNNYHGEPVDELQHGYWDNYQDELQGEHWDKIQDEFQGELVDQPVDQPVDEPVDEPVEEPEPEPHVPAEHSGASYSLPGAELSSAVYAMPRHADLFQVEEDDYETESDSNSDHQVQTVDLNRARLSGRYTDEEIEELDQAARIMLITKLAAAHIERDELMKQAALLAEREQLRKETELLLEREELRKQAALMAEDGQKKLAANVKKRNAEEDEASKKKPLSRAQKKALKRSQKKEESNKKKVEEEDKRKTQRTIRAVPTAEDLTLQTAPVKRVGGRRVVGRRPTIPNWWKKEAASMMGEDVKDADTEPDKTVTREEKKPDVTVELINKPAYNNSNNAESSNVTDERKTHIVELPEETDSETEEPYGPFLQTKSKSVAWIDDEVPVPETADDGNKE